MAASRKTSEKGPQLLELDAITIEAGPEKKGLIKRHVEYCIKSERWNLCFVPKFNVLFGLDGAPMSKLVNSRWKTYTKCL